MTRRLPAQTGNGLWPRRFLVEALTKGMKAETEEEKPGFGCIQSDDRKHCLCISSRSTSNTNATDSHSPPDSSADLLPIAVWSAEIWTSDKKHKDVSLCSDVLALFFFFFFSKCSEIVLDAFLSCFPLCL